MGSGEYNFNVICIIPAVFFSLAKENGNFRKSYVIVDNVLPFEFNEGKKKLKKIGIKAILTGKF